MFRRHRILAAAFIVVPTCHAAELQWQGLPGYSMLDLVNGTAIEKRLSKAPRKLEALGSAGLSWPDGRQAISVTFRVTIGETSWVYRCTDYYDKSMSWTGQMCYEARQAKPKAPE